MNITVMHHCQRWKMILRIIGEHFITILFSKLTQTIESNIKLWQAQNSNKLVQLLIK
jgi:hypothetical protein